MDVAFVHLCILLSVWFLFSDVYCRETEAFAQAVSFLTGFWGLGWTEERGSRKYFLLNEQFDSLHLRTLRCKGHWGRSLAVISICSQKSCHACFEPDLESLEIFGPKCLSRCYLRCFLFVRQVLLDMIECMDQPSLISIKTGQYISLQLDLGSLLFIPDLSDGIFCCVCQATSILFPFL